MKKIIFDLDNTLLFISDNWISAYDNFIKKYNLDISAEKLYEVIGNFEKNMNGIIVTNKILCDYINENSFINITEEMFVDLLDIYANIPLLRVDEIIELLNYLSNKYELIVYTNWFTDNQIERLKKNNLDKYFSEIYGWDILPLKPSKKGLECIIKDDNIDNFIVIGDSIEFDLQVPNSMGMNTIFYNKKQVKQNNYKEINDIVELKYIL